MLEGPGAGDGTGVAVSVHRDRLVSRWLTELQNHGRSEVTAAGYRYCAVGFLKWMDSYKIPFLSLTREDAEQWLGDLRIGGMKASSIRTKFTVVREWYRWMVGRDYIPKDPFISVKGITVPDALQRCLAVSEVRRMVKSCDTPKERAVILTLYSSGMRAGGFLNMKLTDLDLDQERVKIRKKGGGEMYALLSASAVQALREWIEARSKLAALARYPTDALWIGRRGAMKKRQLALLIHAVASRAGLNSVTPHSFRRGFATALADEGVDILNISQLMGHKGIQATEKYTKYSTARVRSAWKKLPPV